MPKFGASSAIIGKAKTFPIACNSKNSEVMTHDNFYSNALLRMKSYIITK